VQYLMATLKNAGYPFRYRDQMVEDFDLEDLVEEVNEGKYDVVGMHANVIYYKKVCDYARALKERTSAKVLIGGPGAELGKMYIDAGADAVCLGEAEPRLTAILDALTGRGALGDIRGLWYRDESGQAVQTSPAPQIQDLNTLPIPYRPPELVPLYGEEANPVSRRPMVSIMASRGCPFKCSFCSSHEVWQAKVRTRSTDHVLAEVEDVLSKWPTAYFTFVDDIFGQSATWVEEFCTKVIGRGLPFKWMCILHPLSFTKHRAKLIPMMKKAGCTTISFGAQSSTPAVLENIRRYAREPKELAECIRLCKENDILVVITYIFGLPGDTRETLETNLRFALETRPHMVDFHPLGVIPGTHIERAWKGKTITQLTQDEIEQACAQAFRRYYLRPAVAWNLFKIIAKNDPRLLMRQVRAVKQMLTMMRPQQEFIDPISATQASRA
jgi:radical SAM superfamily enzyme YgiQ (UPF0313 family)